MFLRIYWGRIESGSWPGIEDAYRELGSIPIPGMRMRWLSRDVSDPDSLYTVTMWDSAEAVARWEASPEYRDVFLARIKPFLTGSHAVTLCEVRMEIVGEAAREPS